MSQITDDDLALNVGSNDGSESNASDSVEVGGVRGSDAVKSIFAPGNRKRLFLYAGAGVLLTGALFFTLIGFDDAQPRAAQGGGGTSKAGRVTTSVNNTSETWIQQQERERYNSQLAETNDSTAHPLLNTSDNDYGRPDEVELNDEEPVDDPFAVAPPDTSRSSVGNSISSNNSERASRKEPAPSYVDTEALDSLIEQLLVAEGGERGPIAQSVVWSYRAQTSEAMPTQSDEEGNQQRIAQSSSGLCESPLARAGNTSMATSDMALNSDVGGPVSFTIRSGELRGAQLLGNFERADTWLRIMLNKMVLKDETVGINALALDVDTTLNAVQGDVDRHIVYRYGWWGFGTALRAIGSAAEKSADTDVYVSDGTVIQSTAQSSKREYRIALGELGQEIGDVMRERINRPITVTLNVGDEVGVFFMDDVCSKTTATAGL